MKIGGNICKSAKFWSSQTRDRFVLSLVDGVTIPFINDLPPIQTTLPPKLRMSKEEMKFVNEHIKQLLAQRFIKKLPHHIEDGWVSNIFLVPKKNGSFHMILNLKELNKYMVHTKFKMDHVDKVIQLI